MYGIAADDDALKRTSKHADLKRFNKREAAMRWRNKTYQSADGNMGTGCMMEGRGAVCKLGVLLETRSTRG